MPPKKSKKQWRPLFHPKSHWKDLEKRTLAEQTLSRRLLRDYAKEATRKRSFFVDKARDVIEQ